MQALGSPAQPAGLRRRRSCIADASGAAACAFASGVNASRTLGAQICPSRIQAHVSPPPLAIPSHTKLALSPAPGARHLPARQYHYRLYR
ncbi:hypothetical protein K525DRAFT_261793 [Schizophyllum commune Loenen D]|nr:hypothetical protein K525DRAFT_261793 [Schizophyllum commune Loenen D]